MKKIQHLCTENLIPDSKVYYQYNSENYLPEWYLENKFIATKYDIKNGEAAKIGEELSSSKIIILYCPFCGKKLIEPNH